MENITVKIPEFVLEPDYPEIDKKLAHLILENVIFCNNGWWYKEEGKEWPEDYITLHVICNDVFAWGCADSEDITHGEVAELYELWRKDPDWGSTIWCIKKRKQMPQPPVRKILEESGKYNLKELIK